MIRPMGAYSTRLAWARTAASNSTSSFTPSPLQYFSRYLTTWPDNTSNNKPRTAANTAVTGTIMSALLYLVDHCQQQYRTDGRGYQLTDHALYRQPEHAKQHAANHRTDNTNTDIGQHAKALAFHNQASQPAGKTTNDQKPDQAHLSILPRFTSPECIPVQKTALFFTAIQAVPGVRASPAMASDICWWHRAISSGISAEVSPWVSTGGRIRIGTGSLRPDQPRVFP